MNIVLVHGFLNRGGILASLAAHLTSVGHCCFTPSLKPCDASCGLEALAQELKCYIHTALPENSRFAIVGFSMGALISRYFLQELGGSERVDAFFSIGGPHAGTVNAYFYPSKGARQMRPRSEFLAQMDRTTDRLSAIPITCYWSPFDLMIRPLSSARWPIAQQVRIPSLVHSLLLFDRRLHQDIERRLAEIQANKTVQTTSGHTMLDACAPSTPPCCPGLDQLPFGTIE